MERFCKGPISDARERTPRDVSVQGGNQSTNISVIRPSRITGSVALPIRLDDRKKFPRVRARRGTFGFLTKKAISMFPVCTASQLRCDKHPGNYTRRNTAFTHDPNPGGNISQ